MFALRGIAVSASIFVLLYGMLSLAVCAVWRSAWRYGQRYSASRCADLLFALRIAPLAMATGVVAVFAVPSFLLLEPRAVNESMSDVPALLGLFGVGIIVIGSWNAAWALVKASKLVARWSRKARRIGSGAVDSKIKVSVLGVSAVAPPLTAAGIFRPSVWLSRAAEFVLSERELQRALQHELVHVRRRDNLRKLMLLLVAFPGMAELETAWREATEMAADDAAVSSASEALDLAAAVIKLSRLAPPAPPAELTTALVYSPAESVNARVERLMAWTELRRTPAPRFSWRYPLCAGAVAVIAFAATYSDLLVRVHAATEWLVR